MQSARGKKSYAFDMTVSFGKNRSARVIMKDSFRQFIDIFTYMVYLKDLHIFTCKNCGTKYLAVADMDYCTAPECLLIWISAKPPNVWRNGKKPSEEQNVRTANITRMFVRWIISTNTHAAESAK